MSSSPGTPLAPHLFPTSGFEVVDPSEAIEEESLPEYDADLYYPVYIGQVFCDRYQVAGKLGYGVTSTVWLARDLVEPDDPGYVALKIYVTGYMQSNNEVAIYEHINAVSAKTAHVGSKDIRKFLSSFELEGPHGKHTCIIQQALGITMDHLLSYLPNRTMTLEAAKPFLRKLLIGLAFLHDEAWSLVSPRTLFRGRDPETNEHHDGYLIAELGAVLGPPPAELMRHLLGR
ncbi:hypothetical protein AJ80_00014 [Polytolypa hystricis UAMH7299]|uniref:non-specific serine/threonine protein kinase n=1 Tax=Polytolypa hystricis (strain UAMH7299) TaxID=1447883 RepID=A0A2B7YVL0_POLH7|nr:hypothetical protein AJ80_00014 [Polytolypa hystricis UAMH7299]